MPARKIPRSAPWVTSSMRRHVGVIALKTLGAKSMNPLTERSVSAYARNGVQHTLHWTLTNASVFARELVQLDRRGQPIVTVCLSHVKIQWEPRNVPKLDVIKILAEVVCK